MQPTRPAPLLQQVGRLGLAEQLIGLRELCCTRALADLDRALPSMQPSCRAFGCRRQA